MAIERLGAMHGGVRWLIGHASKYYLQSRHPSAICIAIAAVDVINAKRGSKKLSSWWKA